MAQNVLSQNARNQKQLTDSKMQAQGQMLEWFFQERTLQLKGMQDDEPVVSRYSNEQWKSLDPWKGVVFFKGNSTDLYGAFDKMMPDAHRKQLTERVRKLRPAGRIEGVYWDSFQWNGSAFIVAYITRNYGAQGFIAQADDWGRSLSLISNDSGWYITNQAGRIIFHSDSRYVGEKSPQQFEKELSRNLVTTNLVGRLQVPAAASTRPLVIQLVLVTLGMALISSVLLNQLLKKERAQSENQLHALKMKMLAEQAEKNSQVVEVAKAQPASNELLFKDLSHRVSSSLGRQLQPAFINILGQSQWLLSLAHNRTDEEKKALETITREARQSKSTLDKLLAVAGENELHKFPMKLETPVLRTLKRWEPEFLHESIEIEKKLGDTSFFPLNSEALEKALSHLIQNSVEAMSRRLDKKITIETKDEGSTLLLAVEDNGSGIEPHHLTLISDPFFTTKNHQNRLGLGLTEAFGIFKQHHAIVSVTSDVGKGTRIEVRFDKAAAQTLMEKAAQIKTEPVPDDLIVIPQNLPRPLEAIETEEQEAPVQVSKAVDEEIEKLLDLTEMDFMETEAEIAAKKEAEIRAQQAEDGDHEETFFRQEASVPIENFLDENPFQAQDKDSVDSKLDKNPIEEEDDFKMKNIPRGLNG